MADPLHLVRDLLRLALDAGASEAEARTAAMAACRLIERHGLLDRSATPAPPPPSPRSPPARPYVHSAFGDGVLLTNRYRSKCQLCFAMVEVGALVRWKRDAGIAHAHCAADAKATGTPW